MVKTIISIIICCITTLLYSKDITVELLQKKISQEQSIPQKTRYQLLLAEAYITSSDYKEAVEILVNTIQSAQKINDNTLLYKSYVMMGRVFFYQKNFEKSRLYNLKAYSIDKTNMLYQANYYKQNGDIYIVEHKIDSAKILFNKALNIYKLINYNDSLEIAKFYANYSILFEDDFVKKLDYAIIADNYFNRKNENKLINKGNIGNAYKDIVIFKLYDSLSKLTPLVPNTREGNFQLAYKYVHEAIAMANLNNDKDNEAYYTGILAEIQEADGDYKNAYYNFRKYYETMDSIYSQDNKNTLANLESQLEINKKNAQIAAQKKLRLGLIIGLALLSVIGILYFWLAKVRKANNENLSQLNEQLNTANAVKTKLFGIISHDLRSPIAQLVTFMHLENTFQGSEKTMMESHKKKVIADAENLLNTMETMLFWSKGQMQNFSPQKKEISIEELYDYLKRFFSTIENIQINYKNPDNISIYTDINFMQIIMQNLSSNAIKATKNVQNASITWCAYPGPTGTILQISDNGPGMAIDDFLKKLNDNTMNSDKSGLGLHIINDLAKAIDVQIEYITDDGKGFTAKISIINSYYCIGYTY